MASSTTTRGTFVFPIHDLDVTGHDAQAPVTATWLRGALEGCEMQPEGPDGLLQVHLSKTGNEVLVQGQIDVQLAIPCARCLSPVHLRPHVELALLLSPGAEPRSGSARKARPAPSSTAPKGAPTPLRGPKRAGDDPTEFGSEEADVDTYEGDEVVLDRFVREAILLESPTFPLCSESCAGIRPASESAAPPEKGVTDPRLLPLLELAKKRNWKE